MTPARAHIVRSVNAPGEDRCVDVFRRADGTFGFEAYRRDPEDPARGWYMTGHHGDAVFGSDDAAIAAARVAVPWLADGLGEDGP